jgi:hypothetical protein
MDVRLPLARDRARIFAIPDQHAAGATFGTRALTTSCGVGTRVACRSTAHEEGSGLLFPMRPRIVPGERACRTLR